MSRETFDAMCKWRADLASTFSTLWQSSRKDERWTAHGHLSLGVIKGAVRAKVIPAKYKHELILEVRNAAGQGVRTPRQLLVGLTVAQSRGPSLRLNLRQRLALRGGEEAQVCGAKPEEACVRHTCVTSAGRCLRIRGAVQLLLRFEV